MSEFELMFTLFSLLLGLAMAEILGDLGRAINMRRRVRVGALTPLLAGLVMLDLSSFWTIAYRYRGEFTASYLVILAVLVFASLYYLAATLVFPEDTDATTNLDRHYWDNRRLVIGAILLLNLPSTAYDLWRGDRGTTVWVVNVLFLALLAALLIANGKRTHVMLLSAACSLYLLGPLARLITG